ncbi:MAG: LysR family transcriptional regulator [Archangium sp.]|nr:LysR family transcriptional regulator [Archangium sp.]
MELSHLRYFFHVANLRSFVRGAQAVHVTPPAISKVVRGLEDELGVQLLERSTRHVRLTRAGEVVLERARKILEEAESLKRDAATASGEIKGELRIAAMEVFSISLLPAALTRLVEKHPGVVPLVYEFVPADMVGALERGLLDVAFTVGTFESAGIDREVLGSSRACVVSGKQRNRVSAKVLAGERWVVPSFFGKPQALSIDQFPDETHRRRVGGTIELLQAGIRLTAGGQFLGCFPEISIRRELKAKALHLVPGAPRVPPFELTVLTRKSVVPSPAVSVLIEFMRAELRRKA